MGVCLEDECVLAYLAGTLPPAEAAGVDRHLADCPPCCALVAETAKLMDDDGHAPTDPTSAPALSTSGLGAGQQLGRYEIGAVLGRGGMSIVYRARDPELDREIAIKVMRPEILQRRGMVESKARVLREARAMAKISHPNVVAIYDVGEWNDEVFVAMELVEGTTLRRWLREQRPSWERVVELFLAAGEGLAAAHAVGLVHRDFKPENVLIGRDGRPRVTDFGLARPVRMHTDSISDAQGSLERAAMHDRLVNLTKTGAINGTPAYMSPEQFLGGALDARTDEFSFCVALFESLYGERPFTGDAVHVLAEAVQLGNIREPVAGISVPDAVRAVLMRGLATKADDRYPTLALLLIDLERAMEQNLGTKRTARRVNPSVAPSASSGVMRWLAPTMAIGAVALLAITTAVLRMTRSESTERAQAAETTNTQTASPMPAVSTLTEEPPVLELGGESPSTRAKAIPPKAGSGRRGKTQTKPQHTATAAPLPSRAPLGDKVENPF